MAMDYEDLGNRIRKQRVLMKMSREQLAREIGVTTSYIGHIERGLRSASLETLVEIANQLEIGLDYLLAASMKKKEKHPTRTVELTYEQLNVLSDVFTVLKRDQELGGEMESNETGL